MNAARLAVVSVAMLCAVLTGCEQRHGSYSHFVNLGDRGWAYANSVKITPEGLDSIEMRRMEVAVRHDNDYPYRNIWLEISYSTSGKLVRDTVQLMLADPYGRWLGKGFGPSYQISLPLGARFRIPDSTEIYIRHVMRVDTLKGIEQIGLFVNSAEE